MQQILLKYLVWFKNYNILNLKLIFYRTMLCMCGASHGPVSVCVCLPVFATSRKSVVY